MSDRTHLLVDDLQSLRAANLHGATVWSCASGLPYLVESDVEVHAPDSLIDQATYDAFNESLLSARQGIASALRAQEARDPVFTHLAATQAAQFYGSFVSFANKGLILARWGDATSGDKRIVAGCADLMSPDGPNFKVGFHDHVFAAIVREMGHGEDPETDPEIGPRLLATPPIDMAKFYQDFHHVPLFDKTFNIVNRTAGAAAYQLWRKVGFNARIAGGRGTILIWSDNEGIEESFLGLVRRGWRLMQVDMSGARPEIGEPAPSNLSSLENALEQAWYEATETCLPSTISSACWRLLWRRAGTAIAAHSPHLRQSRAVVQHWIARFGKTSGPLIVLGSGAYAPSARILDACLREAGIRSICTDHGASLGMLARHDYRAADFISFSDQYCAFTPECAATLEAARDDSRPSIHVIGTPAIIARARWPRIQRRLARRRLRVAADRPLLMYVASLPSNNAQMGYGASTDNAYATFQRRLVALLAEFPGDVVVKAYPAYRFADPDQIWTMPLPSNARRAPFGEFRHLRWAADVLLLDLASSTMGWALGPDIPLIYVDNHHSATTDRAQAALRDAVFYADARARGWENTVSGFLTTPLPEIRKLWRSMASDRASFTNEFVLGERGGFAAGLLAVVEASRINSGAPNRASRGKSLESNLTARR